jgi:hypothetical protein
MYASYNMLYNDCAQTPFTAYTDSSRFFCSSLPLQKQVRKSIDSNQLFPLDIPCVHPDCPINDSECEYKCAVSPPVPKKQENKKPTPILQQTTTIPPKSMKKTKEGFQVTYSNEEKSKLSGQDQNKLLPVMDPQFNLREICKQCILLEDHLSHDEKRCFDCCVKHFLTIEALAEEAITLDSVRTKCSSKIQQLPSRVRHLQSQWHQDPDNNSHIVSQELRKIRKDFQIDAFDVVFRPSSCKDGVCKMK